MGTSSSGDSESVNAPNHSFKSIYSLGEILGEGAFSVVKLATNKKTKQKVAVKIISKSGLSEVDELSLRQEVAILKDLNHPNIVQLVDYFEEPKEYMIALEFLRKFSLCLAFHVIENVYVVYFSFRGWRIV